MVVEQIFELPSKIIFEGVSFILDFKKLGNKSLLVSYVMIDCKSNSKHYEDYCKYNSFDNRLFENLPTKYLWSADGISNDGELYDALLELKNFLKTNNLT